MEWRAGEARRACGQVRTAGRAGAGPGWSLLRSRETLPASHMGQTDRRGPVHLWASTRPLGSEGGHVSGCSGPRIQLARVVYEPGRVPRVIGCSPDPSVMDWGVTRPCSGDPAGGRGRQLCAASRGPAGEPSPGTRPAAPGPQASRQVRRAGRPSEPPFVPSVMQLAAQGGDSVTRRGPPATDPVQSQ